MRALLVWDFRMQYRYGFWIAGLVVTLTWAALLRLLPRDQLEVWLPCLLYLDVGSIGLMFVAGVLFFERRHGVIDALVVTPVPTSVWLASKVLSLTVLTVTVACLLVLLTSGTGATWLRLVPCVGLAAALYTLWGFVAAARLASISSFLVATAVAGLPLGLPLLDYFDVWPHPLLWLNPAHPALVLIRHSLRPGSGLELAAALLLTVAWIGITFRLGVRSFHRRVSWRLGAT